MVKLIQRIEFLGGTVLQVLQLFQVTSVGNSVKHRVLVLLHAAQ